MDAVSTYATRRQRGISLIEFLVAAAIVIGHNVFRILPNEVPILFVLGMLSFRLREGSWGAIGFARPASWKRTILFATGIAVIRLLGGALIESVTAHFWPRVIAPSGANEIAGHPLVALQWLALVWTFAAFGEEVSYRGYLLTRAADVGGRTQTSLWIATVVSGVLFGFGHYYKGPAGVVRLRLCRTLVGSSIRARAAQSVGLHPRAWIHRHGWDRSGVLWIGYVAANQNSADCFDVGTMPKWS